MWLYKPVLRYLQCLTTNHVFPQANSQNGLRVDELFLLWATLHNISINTSAFIANHLEEHAKSSKMVIVTGGLTVGLA